MAAAIADEGESPIPMLELSPMIFKARDIFFAICFSPLNKWLQPVILSMNELFVFFEIQGENFLSSFISICSRNCSRSMLFSNIKQLL